MKVSAPGEKNGYANRQKCADAKCVLHILSVLLSLSSGEKR